MPSLSDKMISALVYIQRANGVYVAAAYPDEPVQFYDSHFIEPQGRTLRALWDRGMVTFDVQARLTPDGRKAIEEDIRTRPGERDFRVVETNEPES